MGLQNTVLILAFALSINAHAGQAWEVQLAKGDGKVEFEAIGKPKMMKIHGKGSKPTGVMTVEDGKVSGQAIFDLNSLDTGIELRNKHMKEKYLEVGKYPKATFELIEIKLPNPLPAGNFEQQAAFKGKLTLRGVTKEVKGIAKLKKEGNILTGNVEFATTVQAFDIELPSFAGITMANEVNVQVEFNGAMVKKAGGRTVASKR